MTDTGVGDITAVQDLPATVEGPIASMIVDSAYERAPVYQAVFLRHRDPLPSIAILARVFSMISTDDANVLTAGDRHVRAFAGNGPHGLMEGYRPLSGAVLWRPRSAAASTSSVRTCGLSPPKVGRMKQLLPPGLTWDRQ